LIIILTLSFSRARLYGAPFETHANACSSGRAPLVAESGGPQAFSQENASFIKLEKALLGCYLLGLLYATGNQATKESLKIQLRPKNLLKNVAYEYTTHLSSTFFHELGHALAAKYFFDSPINIHLGNSERTQSKPLISLPGISIDGFDPTIGHSEIPHMSQAQKTTVLELFQKTLTQHFTAYCQAHNIHPKILLTDKAHLASALQNLQLSDELLTTIQSLKEKNNYKTAIMLLAGGTLGITSHIVIKTILNKLKDTDRSLATAFKKALQPDSIILHNLRLMLIPSDSQGVIDHQHVLVHNGHANLQFGGSGSDGQQLWQILKIPASAIDTAKKYDWVPLILSWIGLATIESSPDSEIITKLLTVILNEFCLNGYLHIQC